MFRTKNPFVADGEVSVQKVEKIEPIYNLDRRDWGNPNLTTMTVVAKPPDVAVSDRKMFMGSLKGEPKISKKYIDDYIAMKKQQFVEPDTKFKLSEKS